MTDYNICDEGVINLAEAILRDAGGEYENYLLALNETQALYLANRDSRGIVGKILEYCTGDRKYMVKKVKDRIKEMYSN